MSKLIHETEKIGKLPERLTEEGYKPPAFVRTYQVGEGKYQIQPCVDFDIPEGKDLLDMTITTLPLFEGSEAEAIMESKRILKDVENWPKY